MTLVAYTGMQYGAKSSWRRLPVLCKDAYSPRSRSQVEPCDFCVRRVIFSRLGVKDGQKCPLRDSKVAAIMFTTPCFVSGAHSSLTLFAKIFLQLVSLTLHVGWDTALFAGKCPKVHLVPLNVGYSVCRSSGAAR
jgi:hypothetical protein